MQNCLQVSSTHLLHDVGAQTRTILFQVFWKAVLFFFALTSITCNLVPASRGYTGGFGVDLMAKDLSLAISAAYNVHAPLLLGAQALQVYNLISAHGGGSKDFSSVYDFIQKKPK